MEEDKADKCPLVVCFLTEFSSTALFIFLGCMVYISGKPDDGPLLPAFAFGLAKLGMFQITVHLTPAHLNPALAFGMFILRKLRWQKLLVYWFAEYTGAMAGYYVLELCAPTDYKACHLAINPLLTINQGFLIEFIISCILMMTVAGAADERLFSDADSTSLRIGLIVSGLFFAAEPYTGACMNPARSLPACVYHQDWTDHWVFQVAPFTGMIAGALTYRYVFDHTHKYSVYNFFDKYDDE